MTAVFPRARPDGYQSHPLHSSERMWPETNCYVDLWIEVLNAAGTAPEAMLGFTLTQDFEGDQFTFFKVPLEDLESLYDIRVTELAIFDRVERHVETQIARGRLCLIEMDSFYMPDTQGTAYRTEHGKTTVAINRLDFAGKDIEYFHNGGYFQLEGKDFDGLFQLQLAGFGALNGHIGFDRLEIAKGVTLHSHAYAHYLHHKYFEVNYGGDGVVPLDLWFGTWHDGSKECETRMNERFKRKRDRLNAKQQAAA